MNTKIAVGALALFAVACSQAESVKQVGNTPAATAAANSQIRLEIGRNI